MTSVSKIPNENFDAILEAAATGSLTVHEALAAIKSDPKLFEEALLRVIDDVISGNWNERVMTDAELLDTLNKWVNRKRTD